MLRFAVWHLVLVALVAGEVGFVLGWVAVQRIGRATATLAAYRVQREGMPRTLAAYRARRAVLETPWRWPPRPPIEDGPPAMPR